jgi:dUTPase
MENKFETRQAMAAEAGLDVKAWLKKVVKLGIKLDKRERISPAIQAEIREKMYGKQFSIKAPKP